MAALEFTEEEKATLSDVSRAAELSGVSGAANDQTTLRGALAKFCSGEALPDPRVIAGVPASEWDRSVGDA
eukprot:12524314-Alexandrium_andersonii.AAC.1